jgi:TetR/AcrR family transcriptional regulator, mexJK operon transcriptional repressor
METISQSRSDRKRSALLSTATGMFLDKGFDGTSMDDVAAKAGVSKPTVYRYFTDKERLFAEAVLATADKLNELVRLVAEGMAGQTSVEPCLNTLACQFVTALMQPDVLRLRRLVIANADRFPAISRSWYEQGFERVLATLANGFQSFAGRKLLQVDDALLAAHHFVGLLLWIPVNRAMFTGDYRSSPRELQKIAEAAVRAFLAGYGSPKPSGGKSRRVSRRQRA